MTTMATAPARVAVAGGAGSTGADISGESVDALGIWGADELTKFEAMVKPWEDETGAAMNFTGSRGHHGDADARVEGGNPPDIALPAEIGLFQHFAEEGKLTPLVRVPGPRGLGQGELPRGVRRPRHGRRHALRLLHEGRHQGDDLVQPQVLREKGQSRSAPTRPSTTSWRFG